MCRPSTPRPSSTARTAFSLHSYIWGRGKGPAGVGVEKGLTERADTAGSSEAHYSLFAGLLLLSAYHTRKDIRTGEPGEGWKG